MIGVKTWSRNYWTSILITGCAVWGLFAWVGPGDDYFRCYTWMVNETWRLPLNAQSPWTLNPTWLAPFMAPFVSLPGRAGYIVFMGVTIALTIYGAFYLGGRPIPILLSAHMMWILWWGQIEAWGILGLVLAWIALERKSWGLMFLALALSAFKPQIGFVPVLALWWWSGRQRWWSLAAMVALFVASLWIWGPWPVWYWQGIFRFVGNQHHGPWNASLGLYALPLFLPAVLLPLDREKRLIALAATTYIVSPYMPYYSTILLLCFAVPGWAYLFGFLGYFPLVLGTRLSWNAIVGMPIGVLLWIYIPILVSWWQARRKGISP